MNPNNYNPEVSTEDHLPQIVQLHGSYFTVKILDGNRAQLQERGNHRNVLVISIDDLRNLTPVDSPSPPFQPSERKTIKAETPHAPIIMDVPTYLLSRQNNLRSIVRKQVGKLNLPN